METVFCDMRHAEERHLGWERSVPAGDAKGKPAVQQARLREPVRVGGHEACRILKCAPRTGGGDTTPTPAQEETLCIRRRCYHRPNTWPEQLRIAWEFPYLLMLPSSAPSPMPAFTHKEGLHPVPLHPRCHIPFLKSS